MAESPSRPRLHGRRLGRPLRVGQQELVARRLPALALTPPAPGERIVDPLGLFVPRPRALWLEIGFGGGEHVAAEANPDVGIIGAEVFINGIATLLREVEARGLANVRILQEDARLLLPALPPASLERVFLLFPDPWPKRRHAKRRFIQPATLDALAEAMADGAEFRLGTDDPGYLRWSLRHLLDHPAFEWPARRPADWRDRPADWPQTRYESKALAAGRTPAFLCFRRRPRASGGEAA